jgi:hypothetical protein
LLVISFEDSRSERRSFLQSSEFVDNEHTGPCPCQSPMLRVRGRGVGIWFPRLVVAVGAIAAAAFYFDPLASGESEDRSYELTGALIGVPVLLSPYIALAISGRRLPRAPGYGCLALLALASAVLLFAARADAQGGLMALWVMPMQWAVAATAYVLASRSMRQKLPSASDRGH